MIVFEGFEAGSITQNKYVYFPLGTNDYSGDVKMGIYGASAMQLGDDEAYADAQEGLLPKISKFTKTRKQINHGLCLMMRLSL